MKTFKLSRWRMRIAVVLGTLLFIMGGSYSVRFLHSELKAETAGTDGGAKRVINLTDFNERITLGDKEFSVIYQSSDNKEDMVLLSYDFFAKKRGWADGPGYCGAPWDGSADCTDKFSHGSLYQYLYGVTDTDEKAMRVTGGTEDGVVKPWMNQLKNSITNNNYGVHDGYNSSIARAEETVKKN